MDDFINFYYLANAINGIRKVYVYDLDDGLGHEYNDEKNALIEAAKDYSSINYTILHLKIDAEAQIVFAVVDVIRKE